MSWALASRMATQASPSPHWSNRTAVYRQAGAKIEGKHPFTAAQLKQLEDDGNWLLQQLRPMGSVRDDVQRSPEAILRDQLWAEMNRRFDEAYKAGVVIWGRREVEAQLPMLGSRQATTTKPDGDVVDSDDPAEPIGPIG